VNADLLVVGAGPAGCAAAMAMRRRAPSLRVVVVDAASFPRDKPCGGAITGGALFEMDRAGLSMRVRHVVAEHAVLRAGGRSHRVRLPRPAAVVHRREWDLDLVAQVRGAGAEVVEGAPLRALRREGAGGVAWVGSREVHFRLAVAADGASGISRRLLALPAGSRVPLREAVVEGSGRGDLVFDLDAGVPGYAWRFPAVRGAREAESAGIYSVESIRDLSGRLRRWMDAERLAIGPVPEAARPWSLRIFDPSGPVGAGPVLLAGEALGVDPLAGEGIRYALWSGRIAGHLAAWALSGMLPPLPLGSLLCRAYRARLATSRSGLALALAVRLAARLYGAESARWRAIASDRAVAEALAQVVSGRPPAGPALRLLSRYRSLLAG